MTTITTQIEYVKNEIDEIASGDSDQLAYFADELEILRAILATLEGVRAEQVLESQVTRHWERSSDDHR